MHVYWFAVASQQCHSGREARKYACLWMWECKKVLAFMDGHVVKNKNN